jgi:hypothetical protein
MPVMTATVAVIALAMAAPLGADAEPEAGPSPRSTWRYILPAPGDPFDHAPFRALVLTREKPEELVEKAAYRGEKSRRRYARIRYGSPSSIRVSIVLDETANGEVDLYADSDRNLRIDDRDRASAAAGPADRNARVWRLPLDVAVVENETVRTFPRAVVFRLGSSGQTLGFATAGYLEGTVIVGGHEDDKDKRTRSRSLAARRVDGDGNGFLADMQDRLFIDSNGDGRFDPGAEQFLFNTVLNLQGARYIVRSDELGNRLAIDPLEGTGTLRLALQDNAPAARAKALEMHATAIGRDGSVFALSGGQPAVVPAGEYRLGNLTIALEHPTSGEAWTFVFSDGLWSGGPRWYKVDKDAAVAIDPIGKPNFELKRFDSNATARPGDDVVVRPALYTGDGLLIVVGYCGKPVSPATQELLGARVSLLKNDGQTLATAHSGFS